VQALKRNQSSNTNFYSDVNNKGDGAYGSNAKIIKTESKRLSSFDIIVGIIGVIGSIITIYLFLKGTGN